MNVHAENLTRPPADAAHIHLLSYGAVCGLLRDDDDELGDVTRTRSAICYDSVRSASVCCVLCERAACVLVSEVVSTPSMLKWFILVSPSALCMESGAKNANQSVSTPPENTTALGPVPSGLQ